MAGPSEPGPSALVNSDHDEQLQAAEAQFQQGIQAIRMDDLDRAVELFGLVLQTRCQKFGDVDIQCASTYFRYGAALFYKAQDEQDVFGAPLQAAAASTGDAAEADDDESEDEKENVDAKGKKPMQEEDLPQAEGTAEDDDGDESPGDRTDMELAWENLEVAKYIYEHDSGNTYAQELAEIHSLLADIGMEQENFESALQDHRKALQLLDGILQADDRRLVELHYKASLTLQYLDQPEEALQEIKTAVKLLTTRIDSIKADASVASNNLEQTNLGAPQQPASVESAAESLPTASTSAGSVQAKSAAATSAAVANTSTASESAAPPQSAAVQVASAVSADANLASSTAAPAPSTAVSDAAASHGTAFAAAAPSATAAEVTKGFAAESVAALQAEAARKELAELEGVLEDMYEKVDELQQIVKEQTSTKNALKAAFSQIAGSLGGPLAGQGRGAGPSKASAAPVVDLGIVGRGTKRVTPMPLPTASTSGSHAGQASRPAAQKRSFEDLMSGGGGLGSSSSNNSNGTTTFGFGQSSSAPTLAAFATAQKPWSQQPFELKKHKTGLGEASVNGSAGQQNTGAGISAAMQDPKTKPALPAFLQAAQVAETYGGSLAAKQNRTQ